MRLWDRIQDLGRGGVVRKIHFVYKFSRRNEEGGGLKVKGLPKNIVWLWKLSFPVFPSLKIQVSRVGRAGFHAQPNLMQTGIEPPYVLTRPSGFYFQKKGGFIIPFTPPFTSAWKVWMYLCMLRLYSKWRLRNELAPSSRRQEAYTESL